MSKKGFMFLLSVLLLIFAVGIIYAQSVTSGWFIPTKDSLDMKIYIGDFDNDGWCPLSLHKKDGRETWSGYGKISSISSQLEAFPRRGGSGDPGRGHFNIRIISSGQIYYNGYTFNSQYGH